MPNSRQTEEKESRFTLRIDKDLLNRVKEQALRNKRSTAKEIEFILEQYFESILTK